MKKLPALLLTFLLLLTLSLTAFGADGGAVRILIDGAPLNAPAAYISEGTTMVPLRALAEALGCEVAWDPVTRTVSVLSRDAGETPADSPVVVLDPGHGGSADGADYGGVKEKNLNLAIASRAARLLEEAGLTVLMTRTGDQEVGLYERTGFANSRNVDLFVSVHCNANVEHDDALGIYTCAYSQDTEGWLLARALYEAMQTSTGAPGFGMEERPNLAVLRTAQMPAALVECGFMSTESELALLTQPDYQARLAQGIADGVLAYLAQ